MIDDAGKKIESTLPLKADGYLLVQENAVLIEMELLPPTELQHEMLAALLDEQDKPEVSVEYTNINNIMRVNLKISHTRDLAKDGFAALALRKEAADRGIAVEDLIAEKNAQAAAAVKLAKKSARG